MHELVSADFCFYSEDSFCKRINKGFAHWGWEGDSLRYVSAIFCRQVLCPCPELAAGYVSVLGWPLPEVIGPAFVWNLVAKTQHIADSRRLPGNGWLTSGQHGGEKLPINLLTMSTIGKNPPDLAARVRASSSGWPPACTSRPRTEHSRATAAGRPQARALPWLPSPALSRAAPEGSGRRWTPFPSRREPGERLRLLRAAAGVGGGR